MTASNDKEKGVNRAANPETVVPNPKVPLTVVPDPKVPLVTKKSTKKKKG
jgi:hypothetical protein